MEVFCKMLREKNQKKWLLPVIASFAVLISITSFAFINRAGHAGELVAIDKDLVIPIREISPAAKFYPVEVEGTRMEIIAVKAPDGTNRTAFNTCQVCFDSGRGYYVQEGNVLVCQNCGNRFRMQQVEVASGGCNPVPIFSKYKVVTDETITIPYDFLKEAKVINKW
jgi:uncharacterized membrane protein